MAEKLTKAQRRALEWFAAQTAPAYLFDREGPNLNMRRWAERAGYLTKEAVRDSGASWVAYSLNEAGRTALQSSEAQPIRAAATRGSTGTPDEQ